MYDVGLRRQITEARCVCVCVCACVCVQTTIAQSVRTGGQISEVCMCVHAYRPQLVQSTRTALSNWNVKARWASAGDGLLSSAVCVCTPVYTQTLYYSTSPPPLLAALHAGRRLSAHVLCGRQRQVPPPPAAHGGGVRVHCDKQRAGGHSLCTCGMWCVCFAHSFTHVCLLH